MSKIIFNQLDGTPSSQPAGATMLYTKTDGLLYGKDAANQEMQVTVLSGGVVTIAGALSASGSLSATNVYATDVYGNAQTMTNAGKVLQVVTGNYRNGGTHGQLITGSTTYVHTSLSAAIVPLQSNSTIHITASMLAYYPVDNGQTHTRITSGGSTESSYSQIWQEAGTTMSIDARQDHYGTGYVGAQVVMQGVHRHDGGRQTYRVEGKTSNASYNMVLPGTVESAVGGHLITLTEIAG